MAHLQALMAGTEKHFPNGNFTLGNVAYTTASLLALLQSLVDAITSLNAAQVSAKDAKTALKGTLARVNPVIRDYRRFLLSAFDGAAQTLADFGLPPSKVRKPMNAEQRAAALEKLRATRKARGTTSMKQKLAVKGNVVGVVVTPVTDPATPPEPNPPSPPAAETSPASPAASASK